MISRLIWAHVILFEQSGSVSFCCEPGLVDSSGRTLYCLSRLEQFFLIRAEISRLVWGHVILCEQSGAILFLVWAQISRLVWGHVILCEQSGLILFLV